MKYLILEPQKAIISATGFTPPNSMPLPESLHDEEAEWLVVKKIYKQVPVPVLDAEGQPVLEDYEQLLYDEQGEPTGETETRKRQVYELDAEGNLVMVESEIVERVEVVIDEPLKAQILADRASAQQAQQQDETLRSIVRNAVAFGSLLMEDFIMENIALGITADGMSEVVLDAMAPAEAALRTGTLYVAIERLKNIPAEAKDAKYITNTRLLQAVNRIEAYLGLPLSETL